MTLADLTAAFFANDTDAMHRIHIKPWGIWGSWLCHGNAGIFRRENGFIEIGIPFFNGNQKFSNYSAHWSKCVQAANLPLCIVELTPEKTIIDTPWGHKVFTKNEWVSLATLIGPPS